MALDLKLPPVLIIWRDIMYYSGWNKPGDVARVDNDTDNICVLVGFLYKENKDYVIVVDSYFETLEDFGSIHKIPKSCIDKIIYLTQGSKKSNKKH